MGDPIVFVSTHDIRPGKLDAVREMYEQGTPVLEAEKPGTVAFLGYLDEDTKQVSTVHVFPDADAFDAHLEGAEDRSAAAAELLEFRTFEIYGTPSDATLEMMEQVAAGGATLTVRPEFVNGYLRLASPHASA